MRTSNHSDEFKRDAVHQITAGVYPVREVSRRLTGPSQPVNPTSLQKTELQTALLMYRLFSCHRLPTPDDQIDIERIELKSETPASVLAD